MTVVYAVQDRTGTVVQVTLEDPTTEDIQVGDTGTYAGTQPWTGNEVDFAFTVNQVNEDTSCFCITTALPNNAGPGEVLQSGWPPEGTITWVTGANSVSSPKTSQVLEIDPANAYITIEFLIKYVGSRPVFTIPESPADALAQAIVNATDYLDQRYRYKGVKLLQFLSGTSLQDPMLPYLDPWLAPFGYGAMNFDLYVPSSTQQHTEWPRQGIVDFSGDTPYGVPLVVQSACAELAARVLNGTVLQPDYNPNVVTNGAVVSELSQEVGPIKLTTTYDTKLGLGFFPDFPQVSRMLSRAGLLLANGGISLIR